MSNRKLPSIPEPTENALGLVRSVSALKEAVEVILGRRSSMRDDRAVTFQDLVDLGLITEDQIPR